MRILVTGISGFVGRRLASLLVQRGDRVSGTYLAAHPRLALAGVELFEADVLDRHALEAAVRAAAPDAVLHLAGLSHVGESWRRMGDCFRVNVLGTENVLAAAGGRRVLLASSAEVYGCVPEAEQPLREDRPLDPRSPYALTKAAAERLAAAQGAVVVRSFNLVGPGQSAQFALPSFAAQLAAIASGAREGGLRVGNLEARRDFLHVEDGAEAYRLLVERGEPGGAYNLGSGEARSIHEALDELLEVSGVRARVEIDPDRLRPADLPLLCADTQRLRALGWSPRRTLRDALQGLWEDARPSPGRSAP